MKYLICIKGDGRGHITQALALAPLLQSHGHEVCAFVVGCTEKTHLPAFLAAKATAPIVKVYSPNFVPDKHNKGISWGSTFLEAILHTPKFQGTFKTYARLIKEHKPDVIINLYDPSISLYSCLHRLPAPLIHIAHQYLMLHDVFVFPQGREIEKSAIVNYTRFTQLNTTKMLALSFYEAPDDREKKIFPVAPILREEIFKRTPTQGDHLLVYVMNAGLAQEIRAFNALRPDVPVHAFWNNREAPETLKESSTLTFHQLNDTLFLDMMASCRGVACTAGFETVSEALYYRKPALLMPSPGQYEQFANAMDAESIGAGKRVTKLDLNLLLDFIPEYQPKYDDYMKWLPTANPKILSHLENPTE